MYFRIFFTTFLILAAVPIQANNGAFQDGEVFAGLAGGQISIFNGSRKRTSLRSPTGGQQTGMCFDIDGNLYTTDFENSSMSKFDKSGRVLVRRWGGPFSTSPESCVVDGQGHVYTGEVLGENRLRKFSSSGKLLDTYRPKVEDKGVDWIDLAADQCTMFYTSESNKVMRYDVCRKKQLSDFAGLQGPCFALRVRENGEVMVACQKQVYRLSTNSSTIRTYPIANETLFAMNLDPDGKHFWTGGIHSGNVYKVHIDSGGGTGKVLFNARGTRKRDSGSWLGKLQNALDSVLMGGLTVYGERTAAIAVAIRKKEEEQKRAVQQRADEERRKKEAAELQRRREAERRAEELRIKEAEKKRLAQEQLDREEAERRRLAEEQRQREEAARKLREEEERKRQEEERKRREEERKLREEEERKLREEEERRRREEEERRRREGTVVFGPPRSVAFGELTAGSEKTGRLNLASTQVEGYGEARLTTTLPTSGLALEIETEDGWKKIGSTPLALALDPNGQRDWALRLRSGRCPPRVAEGESHQVRLEARGQGGETTSLLIPLSAVVRESTWFQCWWPALVSSSAAIVGLFLVYGFISPSRFGQRVGLVLSPEEDMTEGHFHGIRGQPGSRSGFYRDARVYVTPDHRVTGRAAGGFIRLRADRQQVRIQPVAGATVWRLTADEEWQALGPEETRMQFGTMYRDDMKSVFFELRNA